MTFPFSFHENFESGGKGAFDTESDSVAAPPSAASAPPALGGWIQPDRSRATKTGHILCYRQRDVARLVGRSKAV